MHKQQKKPKLTQIVAPVGKTTRRIDRTSVRSLQDALAQSAHYSKGQEACFDFTMHTL